MSVSQMVQANDINDSAADIGIYGLIREKCYVKQSQLRIMTDPRKLEFPEPYQVASAWTGEPWTITNYAAIVQLCGCNLKCDYCFVGDDITAVSVASEDVARDYYEVYHRECPRPTPVFRISGGEPFLQQDFVASIVTRVQWLSEEHQLNGLVKNDFTPYFWIDTNLSIKPTDELLDLLGGRVTEYGNPVGLSVCGCFKPLLGDTLVETQMKNASIMLDNDVDMYFYYPCALSADEKDLLFTGKWDSVWDDLTYEWSDKFISFLDMASSNLGPYFATRCTPILIKYHYDTVGGTGLETEGSRIKQDFLLNELETYIRQTLGDEYYWMPDYMVDIREGVN